MCLSVCLRSAGRTVGPTDLKFGARIKDHHIPDEFEGQGHRSKVKVTKVKNIKIPVFSLVSEKVAQGQGHEGQGQGHKGQGHRSRSKPVGQGHEVKVKVVWGLLYPIDSREVRHAGVFICMYNCRSKEDRRGLRHTRAIHATNKETSEGIPITIFHS